MPDKASEIALEVLRAKGITLELKEVGREEDGELEVVYFAEVDEIGRFLGLIEVDFVSDIVIDAETGEVRDLNRPWWVFLIVSAEPEQLPCTEEAFVCDDGTTVTRNPANNCEFDLCPVPLAVEEPTIGLVPLEP